MPAWKASWGCQLGLGGSQQRVLALRRAVQRRHVGQLPGGRRPCRTDPGERLAPPVQLGELVTGQGAGRSIVSHDRY
jgi:hypothetical protein